MSDDDANGGSGSSVGAGDIARLIPAAILLVALLLFVVANTQKTKVDFVFTEVTLPLILVLLGTAVVGVLMASLIRFRRRHN